MQLFNILENLRLNIKFKHEYYEKNIQMDTIVQQYFVILESLLLDFEITLFLFQQMTNTK